MTPLPRLYLITDRRRLAGPGLIAALGEAFGAGLRLVQLRERDLEAAALLAFAEQAARLAERHGALLLVNDRVDIALLARTAGVHLRGSSVRPADARRLLGPGAIIGASVHSSEEARAAGDEGADFVLFGPVFATAEKARHRPPQGLAELRRASRAARVPLFAVGGVTAARVADCVAAGAHGVAAVSGILAGPSVALRVREYLAALDAAFGTGRGARSARRALR